MIDIRPAELPQDLVHLQRLFREYADGLDVDLGYQGFEAELATLPGKYEVPSGRLLLAWSDTEPVGCVALRPLESGSCEIKRLYVCPQSRGQELGRRLVERICQEAREGGYSRIYLDTLASMKAAIKLYDALGFKPVGPYVFNPIPGAVFLGREL